MWGLRQLRVQLFQRLRRILRKDRRCSRLGWEMGRVWTTSEVLRDRFSVNEPWKNGGWCGSGRASRVRAPLIGDDWARRSNRSQGLHLVGRGVNFGTCTRIYITCSSFSEYELYAQSSCLYVCSSLTDILD
jgi:hypothetical protein